MAKFGTTTLCQTMPRHLEVRDHFLALLAHTFPLCPTTSLQKPPENMRNYQSNRPEASRKQPQPTTGSSEMQPPFVVYASSCAIISELCTKFCSGILRIGAKFSPHQISHIPNCPLRYQLAHLQSHDSPPPRVSHLPSHMSPGLRAMSPPSAFFKPQAAGAVAARLHYVFAYGTLKRGMPNAVRMKQPEKFSRLLGMAYTKDKYPLVLGTEYKIPFMLDVPNNGHNVLGEVPACPPPPEVVDSPSGQPLGTTNRQPPPTPTNRQPPPTPTNRQPPPSPTNRQRPPTANGLQPLTFEVEKVPWP